MKKLLWIVVIGLLFCNISLAEIRLIEEKEIKGKDYRNTISTVCIDGYKFVFMRSGIGQTGRSQSIVQFFEREDEKADMQPPEPARC